MSAQETTCAFTRTMFKEISDKVAIVTNVRGLHDYRSGQRIKLRHDHTVRVKGVSLFRSSNACAAASFAHFSQEIAQ